MDSDPGRWAAGTVISWHYRRHHWRPGDAESAFPVRVVSDEDLGLAVWLAAGTAGLGAARADGSPLRADRATMFTAPRRRVRTSWTGGGVLRIAPSNRPWSVWVSPARWTWYINLEDPLRRQGDAVFSSDHVLDVVVSRDGQVRLKDEDELAEAVRQGRFTARQAASYRADADRAMAELESGAWPFTDGWARWTPPEHWGALPLPPGWQDLVDEPEAR